MNYRIKKKFDSFGPFCDDIMKHYQNGYKIYYYNYFFSNNVIHSDITYKIAKKKNKHVILYIKNKNIAAIITSINNITSTGYKIDFIDIATVGNDDNVSYFDALIIFKAMSIPKIYNFMIYSYIDAQNIFERKIINKNGIFYEFEFYKLIKSKNYNPNVPYVSIFYCKK